MRRKEIGLCLVYRDMWQSSGKYMPRAEQLERIAGPIIEMGCFRRVETNGGGFEQIQLMGGQNPNDAVRRFTQPFREAGIQTQMLERGLNALSMSPAPLDVRKLMFQVKYKQGTDIARSFDGLNYAPNLKASFQLAREAGMIAQGALCMTVSPVHTVEYYIQLADQLIELGAQEICLKDMAGISRPTSIGRITKGIRERHADILIQYHAHATPGFSAACALEAARNGADIIDVGMEPLSWGTGHADLLTIHAMLLDDGFQVPDVNMKAYMEARKLTQEFIDDFLGYYIDPQNRYLNSLLIGSGLPGGMMGSLMADLQNNLKSLNAWLAKNERPAMSRDDLLLRLFEEVEYVLPRLGYPTLVTPYSQYVKNLALMNAVNLIKGKERWSMIDENTWDMILGRQGRLPAPLSEEIVKLAGAQGKKFYYGDPQDLYPNSLEVYARRMDEKGWDYGKDDEDLLEYALHPQQFEDFKSGKAARALQDDLVKKRRPQVPEAAPAAPVAVAAAKPRHLIIQVDEERYRVSVSYDDDPPANKEDTRGTSTSLSAPRVDAANGRHEAVTAPIEGRFLLTRDSGEKPVQVNDRIKAGQTVAYIEAMKVVNAVTTQHSGRVVEIAARHGEDIFEDDVILTIAPE
ncbi:MAG: oxaloacetate decarboxylase [Saprospiraceae bacterium]|nr:oxaloacetate decarboxylase [Saprospiraceae bacterium]